MPCVKWQNPKLTGFKVFRWNEQLSRNNLLEEEGIIVFRRHDKRIKRLYRFNLLDLVNQTPDPATGHFPPREDCLAFTKAFTRSNLFWISQGFPVVEEICNIINSFLEFSGFTLNCPQSPRLVFVVDFSYDPVLFPDCWACRDEDLGWTEPEHRERCICLRAHTVLDLQLGEAAIEEEEEDGVLEKYADPDVSEDEDGGEVLEGEDDVMVVDGADVEDGYDDEVKELVRELRAFRSVGRTYPIMPLFRGDPLGLVQVERPVVERLKETAPFGCPVCTFEMQVGDSVLMTNCGRMLHKVCCRNWFRPDVKCPLCRHCTATLL